MNITDLIEKKKRNKALTEDEISWIIDNYVNGNILRSIKSPLFAIE